MLHNSRDGWGHLLRATRSVFLGVIFAAFLALLFDATMKLPLPVFPCGAGTTARGSVLRRVRWVEGRGSTAELSQPGLSVLDGAQAVEGRLDLPFRMARLR
jgi:hypothetical protein